MNKMFTKHAKCKRHYVCFVFTKQSLLLHLILTARSSGGYLIHSNVNHYKCTGIVHKMESMDLFTGCYITFYTCFIENKMMGRFSGGYQNSHSKFRTVKPSDISKKLPAFSLTVRAKT